MSVQIEGSDQTGYRAVDDKVGPLTGRFATAAEARAAAPAEKPAPKKSTKS